RGQSGGPAAIKHDKGKVLVGCRACPPFKGDQAKPDGKVAVDPESFWPIEGVYRGSFTAPGAEERAVVFEGCEPHAANYGGTLLVEVTAPGSFRARAYYSAVHPESCRPYRRPDGRDLLVCRWSDAHQGPSFQEGFAFDFTAAKEDDPVKGWTSLVRVDDSSHGVCFGIPPDVGVFQGRILGFTFEERKGDRAPHVLIDLEHRHTPYSRALVQSVEKKCKDASPDDPTIDVAKLLGAPRKETVEFVF